MPFTARLSSEHIIEQPLLVPPASSGHKYDRGHAVIISGPALATGASRLAAQAALSVGAGLVSIIGDQAALAEHAGHLTAIMLKRADANFSAIDTRVRSIAAGPAMGVGAETRIAVLDLLARSIPMILNADALTSFASARETLFAALRPDVVLTPHEGDFARLFPAIARTDRLSAAKSAAKTSGAIVLLKGAETIIAAPDGRHAINRHSSPWLATAGSGDVLTGLICGVMAQGADSFDAACIAAWLHGDIGKRHGPGLTADTMTAQLPLVLAGCLAS
jgi:ADP-dependent NAD(P)H-hydrate dehydratase / NAD(P)H-hydrate epimerase